MKQHEQQPEPEIGTIAWGMRELVAVIEEWGRRESRRALFDHPLIAPLLDERAT